MKSVVHPVMPSGSPSSVRQLLLQRMREFRVDRWQGEWKGRHIMRGKSPGPQSVSLVSNDYLSLANHPDIVAAQVAALQSTEASVLMSGVFLHGETPQSRLENEFAGWTGMPEAILSQSGYAANVGLLQAIAGPEVPVYIDMHAHASLWEGITSADAQARPWRHNDALYLRRLLERHGAGVVCVDSVYSTSGSVCHLSEIIALAREFDCLVVVDESHSLGTHGPQGAGMVAALGLQDQVDFITASLAKAFAGRAGLVLAHKGFSDYFWFTARPAIFSSCLLPHDIAAMGKTLEIVRKDDWRRTALHKNAYFLRSALDDLGYNVSESQSQIIALESGTEYNTLLMREALESVGIFGSVFCAPATAKKRALIRFSVNAGLTLSDMELIVDGCARVREKVNLRDWPSTRRKLNSMQSQAPSEQTQAVNLRKIRSIA